MKTLLAVALDLGINEVTLFARAPVDGCPDRVWSSFRWFKNGGASGPWLTDLEAAVLIASGLVKASVYDYAMQDAWRDVHRPAVAS